MSKVGGGKSGFLLRPLPLRLRTAGGGGVRLAPSFWGAGGSWGGQVGPGRAGDAGEDVSVGGGRSSDLGTLMGGCRAAAGTLVGWVVGVKQDLEGQVVSCRPAGRGLFVFFFGVGLSRGLADARLQGWSSCNFCGAMGTFGGWEGGEQEMTRGGAQLMSWSLQRGTQRLWGWRSEMVGTGNVCEGKGQHRLRGVGRRNVELGGAVGILAMTLGDRYENNLACASDSNWDMHPGFFWLCK